MPRRAAAWLFRAYFGEGGDIGDPEVVRELAAESGLDVERMQAALQVGTYEAAIRDITDTARGYGITGPLEFAGRYAAVGAQPTEELRRVVDRILQEQ